MINEPNDYVTYMVECDICAHVWNAMMIKACAKDPTYRIECPACGHMCSPPVHTEDDNDDPDYSFS